MKVKITNNILFKCISVIVAVVLWLLVIKINDPVQIVTIRNIPVTILNDNLIAESEQVYEIILGKTATVTVKGPKSMVDSLSAKDFTATADFKDMSQTNAIPIYVTLNDTKYASKLDWSLDVKNVRVALEDVLSKEFQIIVEQTGETAQNFTIGNFVLSENTVMVKAPVSIMQMINKAVVEVDVKGINKDFTKDLNIKLLSNTNTEIKINEKNVQVS